MNTFSTLSKHRLGIGLFLSAFALVLLLPNALRAQVGNDNPTGPAGEFNGYVSTGGAYDPYTGNVTRKVTDMVVSGAVGQYGLSWSRTWNSRSGVGSWQHNYSWTIDSIDAYAGQPMHRIVTFPDGRVVNFGSMFDGNRYYGSVPGVSERLKEGPAGSSLCFLILPDGGRVEFSIVSSVYYDWEMQTTQYTYDFTAQALIDPHGLRTTLVYEADGSFKVTEPAGRWIKQSFIPAGGGWNERVTASDGREINYTFQNQAVAPGTVPHRLLTSVSYYDGTSAVYTHQAPNVGSADGVPLLSTCDDPMYAGSMRKISYTFATGSNADGSAAVYGQILSEKHPNGTSVSSLSINGNSRTETRGDGPTRTFNYTGGKLASFTDFKNQSSSLSYDTRGFVNAMVDRRQNQTDMINEPLTGKAIQVTHPLTPPDTVRARVQSEFGNANCHDPNNRDGNNPYYVCRTTNERNHSLLFWRDASKRVIRIDHPDGGFETFTYNAFGQVLTHRLTSGGTESFGYDEGLPSARGLRTSYTPPPTESDLNPSLHPTRYHYDSMDRIDSVTDPRGNTTYLQHTSRGQVKRVTHPGDSYVETGYDGYGNRQTVRDELNHTTTYAYDDYNRLTSTTNPLNQITTINYAHDWANPFLHTSANPKYVNSHLGKNVVFGYDENLRRAYKVDALSTADEAWILFGYDAAGNLTSVTDPRSKATSFGYDARNRQTSVTDALNHSTVTAYDAAGNKTSVTRSGNQPVQFIDYDPMNRLKEQIDERGFHTWTGYDSAGNVSWFKDANQKVYSYEYDDLNRKIKAIYPAVAPNASQTEEWTYDIAGNPHTSKNRAGAVQTYAAPDTRNRPTSFSWSDGTPGHIFTFDNKSRPTRISSTEAEIDFGYDHADRKTSETVTVRSFGLNRTTTVSYQYDDDGNRSRTIYPAGYEFIYAYTQRNQLANIKLDPAIYGAGYATPAVAYTYDVSGNRTSRTLLKGASTANAAPGASTQYTPDDVNRLYSQSTNFANSQVGRFDYGYDALNRRKYEQRDSGVADGFQYDPTGQVNGYQKAGTLNVADGTVSNPSLAATLASDGAGNRTQVTGSWYPNTYVSNALNQYTSDMVGQAGYDGNGNLHLYAGWTFTYDAMNRLTELSHPGTGQHISYRYDPLNRRIAQQVGVAKTSYVYDGWNLIEERPTDGRQPHCYLFGGATNELVVSFGSGYQNLWYFQDGSGNTSHLTDNEHAVLERYTYHLGGKVDYFNANNVSIAASAFDNRFLFAGAILLPEIQLYDMRNRIYYPRWGRFLQPDPIGFAGGDANLYRYCGGDPVNNVDPMGLEKIYKPLDGITDPVVVDSNVPDFGGTNNSMGWRDIGSLGGLGALNQGGGLSGPSSGGGRSLPRLSRDSSARGNSPAAPLSTQGYWTDMSGLATGRDTYILTDAWLERVLGEVYDDIMNFEYGYDVYPGETGWRLFMSRYDTEFYNGSVYRYEGQHAHLRGIWVGFQVNYIGVGQGFAGHGVSRGDAINWVAWWNKEFNNIGFASRMVVGKTDWMFLGYDYFSQRRAKGR